MNRKPCYGTIAFTAVLVIAQCLAGCGGGGSGGGSAGPASEPKPAADGTATASAITVFGDHNPVSSSGGVDIYKLADYTQAGHKSVTFYGTIDANGYPTGVTDAVVQGTNPVNAVDIAFDSAGTIQQLIMHDGSRVTFDYSNPQGIICRMYDKNGVQKTQALIMVSGGTITQIVKQTPDMSGLAIRNLAAFKGLPRLAGSSKTRLDTSDNDGPDDDADDGDIRTSPITDPTVLTEYGGIMTSGISQFLTNFQQNNPMLYKVFVGGLVVAGVSATVLLTGGLGLITLEAGGLTVAGDMFLWGSSVAEGSAAVQWGYDHWNTDVVPGIDRIFSQDGSDVQIE